MKKTVVTNRLNFSIKYQKIKIKFKKNSDISLGLYCHLQVHDSNYKLNSKVIGSC